MIVLLGHQHHVLGDLIHRNFLEFRRTLAADAWAGLSGRDIANVAVVAEPVEFSIPYYEDVAYVEFSTGTALSF